VNDTHPTTLAELWEFEPDTEFRVHFLTDRDDPLVGSIVPVILTFEQWAEFLRRSGFTDDTPVAITSWQKLPRVEIVPE
jgi:hypothetical protein